MNWVRAYASNRTHLTRARLSVATIFALNGFLASLWIAHIPVITDRTGTSHEVLGGLLLLIGGSACVAMQLSGPLIDRIGSRPTTIGAASMLCVVMLGPINATSPTTLAMSLAAFGFANGALDVSMNAQAVQVEQGYGRPIMSSFHGWFSAGGLVGSGVVALGLWLGWAVQVTVAVLCALGVVVVVTASRALLGKRTVSTTDAAATGGSWWREVDLRRLFLLAALAFVLMLAEGTAYDWSALHIVETFGSAEAVGAIAFGCFSAAMMVARFGIDPIAHRVGAVAVVRGGAIVGMVGMGVALAPSSPGAASAATAIVGWTIFGIGLAGLIPQIFTAAGNLTPGASGRSISVVVGCGYLAMLAGPAVVGFITGLTSLRVGLTPVLAALLFSVLVAGVVGIPRSTSESRGGHDTLEG